MNILMRAAGTGIRRCRPLRRERETLAAARMSQVLANSAEKLATLSPSAKQNPTVASFRYRGVEVAGAGFEPTTSRL